MSASVVPTGPVCWWKEAISAEHCISITEVVADLPAVQHGSNLRPADRLQSRRLRRRRHARCSRQTLRGSTAIARRKESSRPSTARSKIPEAAMNLRVSAISVENAGASSSPQAIRAMLSRPNAHCPERMLGRRCASHGTSEPGPTPIQLIHALCVQGPRHILEESR
jgi:hypothetical protein